MFNAKTMGNCNYSVPSKDIVSASSGGCNELEMATADARATAIALVPIRNPILILSGLPRWIKNKNTNKIRKKLQTEVVLISERLNGRRRRGPGPTLWQLHQSFPDALDIR